MHTFTIIYFVAQAFGFLVEYISTPKALVDTTVHYRPVGPYEFSLWREGIELPSPIERYRNDPTALKIISQDQWTLDRPLYDIQATNTVVGAESDYFVQAQRRQNYFRRMVPHVFGWFTMMSAWVIITVHLEWAKHDLAKITDREIPSWVNGAVYGTVIIVSDTFSNSNTHTPTHTLAKLTIAAFVLRSSGVSWFRRRSSNVQLHTFEPTSTFTVTLDASKIRDLQISQILSHTGPPFHTYN